MSLSDKLEWYGNWAAETADLPLYARLSRQAATDTAVLRLVRDRLSGQPAPQLLLGAVHERLLSGIDHPLAEWYPTCVENPYQPAHKDPYPAFQDFCATHDREIKELVTTRRVSTNAVGRSAILYPAFAHIAARNSAPLEILEIGASAGLNLLWNTYHYRYDGRTYGDLTSSVTIESKIQQGTPPLPAHPPAVLNRFGIDLDPLDLTNPVDTRWLRSLVVPDHLDRYERLTAAIAVARDNPPSVATGDAIERFLELLNQLSTNGTPCLFSTHVRYQMDEMKNEKLDEYLINWSQENQRIHSLYTDNDVDCPGNGYRHVVFEDGKWEMDELIGSYESYGLDRVVY